MRRVDSLEKTDAGRDWGQEEKGTTEDEMTGWHHGLHRHESEWTPGDGDGQEGLACCDSWGCKELDTTDWLNWTELNWSYLNSRTCLPQQETLKNENSKQICPLLPYCVNSWPWRISSSFLTLTDSPISQSTRQWFLPMGIPVPFIAPSQKRKEKS